MEHLAYVAFGIYTLIILTGGLMAVLCRSMVRALVGLILTLFGVAGCYLLMAAPFIALMQILIYVGAVSILILFAIMLTRAPAGAEEAPYIFPWRSLAALAVAFLPLAVIGGMIRSGQVAPLVPPEEVPLAELGQTLIEPYLLAFELISVILTVAMAGAVILGFERRIGK